MRHYIYILKDPDTYDIKYVGETSDTLARLKGHIYLYKGTQKCKWTKNLLEDGKFPILEVIEETDIDKKSDRERYWIMFYEQQGYNLLNMKRGGVREGSGRKLKFNEPTKVIRVPVSLIPEIEARMAQMTK